MADIRICPDCQREVDRADMEFTRDCYGIPMKCVCWKCYEKRMAKGYDGVYYTSADENIEEDW